MKRAFSILLLLLVGCVQTTYYFKPGGTQQEFSKDIYECERDTRLAASSFKQPRKQDSQTGYHIHGNTVTPSRQPDGWASLYNLGSQLREQADTEDFFNLCMRAKGYTIEQEEGSAQGRFQG